MYDILQESKARTRTLPVLSEETFYGKLKIWLKQVMALLRHIDDPEASKLSKLYKYYMIFMAMISTLLISFSTEPSFSHALWIRVFEHVIGILLCFDCVVKYAGARSTLYFFTNIYNGVDILNTIPYLLFIFNWHKLRAFELFYLMRITYRLFKIMKYSSTVMLLSTSISNAGSTLLLPMFLLLEVVMTFACLIYFFERDQSNGFFKSQVSGMWFAMVTVSTVGYGDMYPVTWQGRLVTAFFIIIGIMYIAIPIGIMGGSFSDVWGQRNKIVELEKMRRRLLSSGLGPEDILSAFERFDSDISGEIDFHEFKDICRFLKLEMQHNVCAEIFRVIDTGANGTISKEEFQVAIFPREETHKCRSLLVSHGQNENARPTATDEESDYSIEGVGLIASHQQHHNQTNHANHTNPNIAVFEQMVNVSLDKILGPMEAKLQKIIEERRINLE